jgi:hypothetical protein
MKIKILLFALVLLASSWTAQAQTIVPDSFPATDEKVCISKPAAEACSKAFDVVKAQEKEIAELKEIISDLKVKLAEAAGRNIAGDAERIRLTQIVDSLLKNPRKVTKIGLFNLF